MNFKDQWHDGGEVQAQKDVYKGVEYRSKLESKTAQALDILGIAYDYEPKGYKLTNGLWYKPDFYLPGARQFVECKGVMDEKDSAKIIGLVEDTSKPVLVLSYTNAMLVMRHRNDPREPVKTYAGEVLRLVECKKCGTRRFLSMQDTLTCPNCLVETSGQIKWLATVESGQSLFEHGQQTAADKPIYKQMANNFNN